MHYFKMISSIKFLSPEIFLSAVALILLGADAFVSKRLKWTVFIISVFSLFVAFLMVISASVDGRAFGMLVVDPFSTFFKILALIGCFLVLLISEKDHDLMGENAGAYVALLLLSTVGTMLLSSAEDLLILFISLELTTLPLFILAGFLRKDIRSSEGAIKFFLIGALSAGLMIYGMSYLYGICGSTHFSALHQCFMSLNSENNTILFLIGILFLLVGLGFKLSLVPFHEWTPDAYEGAPTPVTAFFSISREAGVIAVMLRFFSEFVNLSSLGIINLFFVLSVLTMTLGNLTALRQNNLKRMLAYSSIAHAGTIVIGLIAGNQLGREGAMLYSFTYFLMSLGAFAVVIAVSRVRKTDDISAFSGLGKENFPLSLLMLFFLFSLSGIPPFLGFWGKFYVFAAAVESGMYWLVAIALINAVIAVYYYFRIAHSMFFKEAPESQIPFPEEMDQLSLHTASILAAGVLLFFGIFPETLLAWIKNSAHLLP